MKTRYYEVGSKMVVPDTHYDDVNVGWDEKMDEWVGKEMTIRHVYDNRIYVEENYFIWLDSWVDNNNTVSYEDLVL